MKVKLKTRVTIGAPANKVFRYLSELQLHYLWNPQIQELAPLTRLKKGTVYKTVSTVLGTRITATNEVTKFVPKQEIQIENNTGTVHYVVNYCLCPSGERTQVICTTEVSTEHKAYAFAQPILKMLARRELQADLQALKLAVEYQLQ